MISPAYSPNSKATSCCTPLSGIHASCNALFDSQTLKQVPQASTMSSKSCSLDPGRPARSSRNHFNNRCRYNATVQPLHCETMSTSRPSFKCLKLGSLVASASLRLCSPLSLFLWLFVSTGGSATCLGHFPPPQNAFEHRPTTIQTAKRMKPWPVPRNFKLTSPSTSVRGKILGHRFLRIFFFSRTPFLAVSVW